MKANLNDPGRVVISTDGHDKGRYYAVLRSEANRLMLTDGDAHPIQKPKAKNPKHLQAIPFQVQTEGAGGSGGPVCDGDIRKALRQCKCVYETQTGRPDIPVSRNTQKEDCALVQK